MKHVFKFFSFTVLSLWELVYFGVAIVIILVLSYVLGHTILDGNYLIGNDSSFALSLVYWFDRFYPRVPIWYPLQGMGVSLFYSYPMGTTFLIIFLKSITHLSAVYWFRVLSFSAFPGTAVGIFLLCWIRLRNQTIGLLAAVFFLLSEATWLFQVLHGIFAQSFSLVSVPIVFLFFDLFLVKALQERAQASFLGRLYFVLTILSLTLTLLLHVVTGTMVIMALGIWVVLRFLQFGWPFHLGDVVAQVFKSLFLVVSVVILAGILGGFWLFPFEHYTALANRGGLNTRDLGQLQEEALRIPSMLGLSMLGEGTYRYDFFFFATPVLILFGIGTITSFIFRKRLIQIFAFISVFFMFLTTVPVYLPFVASMFKYFFTGIYFRGLIPALVLLPIVAAWGAYSLPALLFELPTEFFHKKLLAQSNLGKLVLVGFSRSVVYIICSVIAIGIAVWMIYSFQHSPPPNPEFAKTYKYKFAAYGPDLDNAGLSKFMADPVGYFRNFHGVQVSPVGLEGLTLLNKALGDRLQIDQATDIMDVSPYAAGGAIMQGVGLVNDIKFVNLYHYYASLIHGMWGYEEGQFYGKEPLYASKVPLGDLTDWFGLKYVAVVPGFDPYDKYKANGWTPVTSFNTYSDREKPEIHQGRWGFEIMQNPHPNGLYTLTSKPAVLAIGNFNKGFFDHVFRSANLGALPYKDALIVQGSQYIDDYSPDQFSQFKAIILDGYSYHPWSNAWGRITDYVKQGGMVFVDTGWQFVAQDWGNNGDPSSTHSLPDVFPVRETHWGNIGTTWDGVDVNSDFAQNIDFNQFSPPVWDGNPWGMALSNKSDLRDGAKPILSKGDAVLMAERDFGAGKIIWSGINVFSHTTGKMNDSEGSFLGQLFHPWFAQSQGSDLIGVTMQRDFPDTVDLAFSQPTSQPGWLLFRESYSPYWHVQLDDNGIISSLPFYSAGPGFVLVHLPALREHATLRLQVQNNLFEGFISQLLSIGTLFFLFAYLLLGRFLLRFELAFLKTKRAGGMLKHYRGKMKTLTISSTSEEEDY